MIVLIYKWLKKAVFCREVKLEVRRNRISLLRSLPFDTAKSKCHRFTKTGSLGTNIREPTQKERPPGRFLADDVLSERCGA
jgi:hypothetical protein